MSPKKDDRGSFGPWKPKGTKVKFLGKNGRDAELEKAKQQFVVGEVLTVADSQTFGFSSNYAFEGVEGTWNTVMFGVVDDAQ